MRRNRATALCADLALASEEVHSSGDVLTARNLRSVRAELGPPPKYSGLLLGRRVNLDVRKSTRMSWDLFG